MLTEKSLLTQQTNDSHQNVLIVGGGPAGLATALMLAKRGWTNITVLEACGMSTFFSDCYSVEYCPTFLVLLPFCSSKNINFPTTKS